MSIMTKLLYKLLYTLINVYKQITKLTNMDQDINDNATSIMHVYISSIGYICTYSQI